MSEKNIIKKFLKGEVQFKNFDKYYADLAKNHQNNLTKPRGSLGKLEKYAIWMAGWQKKKAKKEKFSVSCFCWKSWSSKKKCISLSA